jgi:hypothetical protein
MNDIADRIIDHYERHAHIFRSLPQGTPSVKALHQLVAENA